ncbi:MAG: ABC transporter substrate-binding protein [Dermatophilus congolensis]|nr:ABC transporter substrate-binding protein [Dermatophilus congolensis]
MTRTRLTRTTRSARIAPLALVSALALAACGGGESTEGAAGTPGAEGGNSGTVSVTDNNGTQEIPVNPARVVALDNTSFETLKEFGITPVAAPKQLLPAEVAEWKTNADIIDVGTHREPKLEAVNEAKPDLIIGGKRFMDHTDTLKQIAPVLDLSPSVEATGYIDKLKHQTTVLGQVFDKPDAANQLNAKLDASVAKAAGLTNGQTVFLANHNGGKIDNGAGRIAPLLQPLNMTDVFAKQSTGGSDSVHQDSGLAPETVAQANPDWMFVMDRDAATAEAQGTTAAAAKSTIAAQKAWANTTFVKNDQIVFLDPGFYYTEGIQAYTAAYDAIGSALEKAAGK